MERFKRILYGDRNVILDFASNIIPIPQSPNIEAIGVLGRRSDRIIAAFLYSGFDGRSLNLSVASSTSQWARPDAIQAMLAYPFIQLGCDRISALTNSGNVKAKRMAIKLGFKEEGLVRRGCPNGDDLLILGLLKEEARMPVGD